MHIVGRVTAFKVRFASDAVFLVSFTGSRGINRFHAPTADSQANWCALAHTSMPTMARRTQRTVSPVGPDELCGEAADGSCDNSFLLAARGRAGTVFSAVTQGCNCDA
jgi:hypothetical protein